MKRLLLVIILTVLLPDVAIWQLYLSHIPLWACLLWFVPSLLLFAAWLALLFEFRHSMAARTLNSCIVCFVVPKICFLLFQFVAPWVGIAAAMIAELLALYGLTLGWRKLKVRHIEIPIAHLPSAFDGYRILHLSDLHVGTFGQHSTFVSHIVEKANEQKPDMMVFTGDLVNKVAREVVPYRHDLASLNAPDGVFAVLGNHDYCEYGPKKRTGFHDRNFHQLGRIITHIGWTLLLDDHRLVERQGQRIAIAGVENIGLPPFPAKGCLEKALRGIPANTLTILLSHDPNHWRSQILGKQDIALTLSGHTHGAQVRLGRISLARFAYHEWGGLYHKGEQWLYVSLGLGGAFPFRLGAWPEMTVIELKASPKSPN